MSSLLSKTSVLAISIELHLRDAEPGDLRRRPNVETDLLEKLARRAGWSRDSRRCRGAAAGARTSGSRRPSSASASTVPDARRGCRRERRRSGCAGGRARRRTRSRPRRRCRRRASRLISVDLPAPFSPSSTWPSPRATSSETPLSATTPGKRFPTPVRVRMAIMRIAGDRVDIRRRCPVERAEGRARLPIAEGSQPSARLATRGPLADCARTSAQPAATTGPWPRSA